MTAPRVDKDATYVSKVKTSALRQKHQIPNLIGQRHPHNMKTRCRQPRVYG